MNQHLQRKRILSITLGYDQDSYMVPNEDAIHACLHLPKHATATDRLLPLPSGEFDIQTLLDQLPSGWTPDLVFVSSSLAMVPHTAIPRGLERLDCPTVMKLTDSHHSPRPIQKLIDFARLVNCQYHWTIYNRHHLHFFKAAGLSHPFWMPGSIAIPAYDETELAKARSRTEKPYGVVFCGHVNPTHFYRTALIERLQARGLEISVIGRPSYTDYLKAFTEAKIVLNFSLNGDLNRRLFEILLAGGFVLTDRLAPESGLPVLFEEGKHLESYSSETELVNQIHYYLDHPDEAMAIAQQGHRRLVANYHPDTMRLAFWNYVVNQQPLADEFLVTDDRRLLTSVERPVLGDRIALYELIQDLQRLNLTLKVLYYQGTHSALLSDGQDLYRTKIVSAATPEELAAHQTSPFQVILIDVPPNADALQALLKSLNPYLYTNALLILVGRNSRQFDALLKSYQLLPLSKLETAIAFSSQQAYSVYYQASKVVPDAASPAVQLRLPVRGEYSLDRPSLPARIVRKAKALLSVK